MKKLPITVEAPVASARPKCPACLLPLRPDYETKWADQGKGYTERASKAWVGKYHGYPPFCTLRCALHYATVVYRQYGYVLKKK